MNHYKESINPYIKSQTPYNGVLYLYFHDEHSTIGHYCLIDKNNVLAGIQEIKQNFVKR